MLTLSESAPTSARIMMAAAASAQERAVALVVEYLPVQKISSLLQLALMTSNARLHHIKIVKCTH